jgi:hypothetical protein
MVVNYFDNPNCRDLGLVEATGWLFGKRFVVRLEDEPRRASKVERVLSSSVSSKGVEATWSAAHVGERRSRPEDSEATPQRLPLLGAKAANTGAIRGAIPRELPVCPGNVNRWTP